MALNLVERQSPVPDRAALAPAVHGLAETLKALPVDGPDYSLMRRMHRLLAGDAVLEVASPSRVLPAAPYPEAVQPAIEGLKATYEQLEPDHWARTAIRCQHSHLRWNADRARRNGGQLPPRDPEELV